MEAEHQRAANRTITRFLGNEKRLILGHSKRNVHYINRRSLDRATENGNCLVILNTKKTALEIYNKLHDRRDDFKVLHLSTNMCPAHRIQVIDEMKKDLDAGKKIICVSTQLIEAGVDISFSCVVRAMAGLDSIAQSAGRCNRNGESDLEKNVYAIPIKDESVDKLPDIKSGKEISKEIIRIFGDRDLLDEEVMNSYYKKYFDGKSSQLDYPTKDNRHIYTMLANNNSDRIKYANTTGEEFPRFLAQAFQSADESFSVIDNKTKPVIVFYGEAEMLVNEYKSIPPGIITKRKFQIIKKLHRFSVSLYDRAIDELSKSGAISVMDEELGILLLDEHFYNANTGVSEDVNPEIFIQ